MTDLDLRLDDLRRATMRHRVVPMCQAILDNLPHTAGRPAVTLAGQPLAGRPCIVASAGPSLDRNAHLLVDTGIPIVAVNSAIGALVSRGVTPTAGMAIECLDVSEQLVGCSAYVTDLGAHPDVFVRGDAWVAGGGPHVLRLLRPLGTPPLGYSSSVATAAYAMARRLGADPVILVGQDLAHDLERGTSYASGAQWDGLTVTEEEGELVFAGREDRDALHRGQGIPAIPRRRYGTQLDGWDGPVWTTMELYAQHQWFTRHTRPTDVNASEGGALIPPMQHMPLVDALEEHEPRKGYRTELLAALASAPSPSRARVKAAQASLRDECDRAQGLAHSFLDGTGDHLPALGGMPFVSALVAGDLLGLKALGLEPSAGITGTYETYRAAAQWIRERVGA